MSNPTSAPYRFWLTAGALISSKTSISASAGFASALSKSLLLARKLFVFALYIFSLTHLSYASAQTPDDEAAWEALRSGTAVALMRHALAPGVGDPQAFDVNDCSTQRNLSAEGRAQAQSIGDKLRENGINDATVLTSQWCRCVDTATLLNIGTPEEATFLNSIFRDRSTEPEQTHELASYIESSITSADGPIIMVTHQVNISALTNQFTSSGDMLIVTLGDNVEVLARIRTDAN